MSLFATTWTHKAPRITAQRHFDLRCMPLLLVLYFFMSTHVNRLAENLSRYQGSAPLVNEGCQRRAAGVGRYTPGYSWVVAKELN